MTLPTDCDQRDERVGWTGNADLSCDSPSSYGHLYLPQL